MICIHGINASEKGWGSEVVAEGDEDVDQFLHVGVGEGGEAEEGGAEEVGETLVRERLVRHLRHSRLHHLLL